MQTDHTIDGSYRFSVAPTRTGNEGSRRLLRAASAAGVAVLQEHGLTDAQCDADSRRARELNLGRFLLKGYVGPWWSAKDLALLGTLPGAEVGRRTGRSKNAVTVKRNRLGIVNRFEGRRRGTRWGTVP